MIKLRNRRWQPITATGISTNDGRKSHSANLAFILDLTMAQGSKYKTGLWMIASRIVSSLCDIGILKLIIMKITYKIRSILSIEN